MAFSDIGSKNYNDINEDIFGNRIMVLKKSKVIETVKNNRKGVGKAELLLNNISS